MFKEFIHAFTETSSVGNKLIDIKAVPYKWSELLLAFGGKSFDNGLYTIHNFEDSLKWTALLSQYFKKYNEKSFISFAHDWMGRQFCVSRNDNECIYMFDSATFEDFFLDENLFAFHNSDLADNKFETLASDSFDSAIKFLNIESINYYQCIGFKKPLFLGGKEEVSNYEVSNLETHWEISYQLQEQVKDLPDGTKISQIGIAYKKDNG